MMLPDVFLPLLFCAVAWLYSMAGFGGGSTYIALLVISGLPLTAVPVLALTCNLVVSTQGSVVLIRQGHADWGLLRPLLLGSLPCAFVGGAWRVPESAFIVILAAALSLAALAMLLQKGKALAGEPRIQAPTFAILLGVGMGLGLLAGITGIGGGIYLAPVMHLLGWARAQSIAACTSLFISLNSLAGLLGQLSKGLSVIDSLPLLLVFACPLAVLVGGRCGSCLLADSLSQRA